MLPNDLESLVYPLRDDVESLSRAGYVSLAREQIAFLLAENRVDPFERERLELEDHLLLLRQKDFPFDEENALLEYRKIVPEATKDNLESLRREGRIPFSLVDGQIRYHRRFLDTIGKATASQLDDSSLRDEMIARMRRFGSVTADITVHIGLSLRDEAAEAGKMLNVDLPVPVRCPFLHDVRILRQSGQMVDIDAVGKKRRTAHFRGKMEKGEEFWIEYSFTNTLPYNRMDLLEQKCKPSSWHAREQRPYLVGTRYLEDLAKDITGEEENPLSRARKIYSYITKNVSYAYMPSYQTIPNLAEYGAAMRRGDCGIQAALFINLCRVSGIKAGWMGGMYVRAGEVSNHDWASFEIPGLPMLYADCSFGGSAYRQGNEMRWSHYFGNLDPMRLPCTLILASARDAKRTQWLVDPTDNQSGEAWYDDAPVPREFVVAQRKTVKFALRG